MYLTKSTKELLKLNKAGILLSNEMGEQPTTHLISHEEFKRIRRNRKYSNMSSSLLSCDRGFELMRLKSVWIWL